MVDYHISLTKQEQLQNAIMDLMLIMNTDITKQMEMVLYRTEDDNVTVNALIKDETIWLTQKAMAELFGIDKSDISRHLAKIFETGELDEASIGFSDKSSGGRKPKIYNLDIILSVGYRVNSKHGIAFRRWANSVLKQYVIQGYAINEKRLQALERTVDIQTKMLACTLEVEESDILKAVTSYTDALMLLDQYDHQSLKKPVGNSPIYKITYEECKKMVSMSINSGSRNPYSYICHSHFSDFCIFSFINIRK